MAERNFLPFFILKKDKKDGLDLSSIIASAAEVSSSAVREMRNAL